jgi:hypothetical protein
MSPISNKGKVIRVIVSLLLLGIVGFFAGRYILYVKIRNTIEHELASLKKQGIHVSYENLELYPWDGKIEVHELTVKVRKDSTQSDSTDRGLDAYLPYVTIEGIDLLPFLKEKTLAVRKIHSFETYITYRMNSTLFEQDKSSRRKIEVRNIAVDKINFPRIDFYLTDEHSSDTVAHILSDVDMNDIFLAKQLDSLTWQKGVVDISNFAMNYKEENYGVSIRNVTLGISDKSVQIDSFRIKPLVGRNEFMQLAGKQSTYMELVIPYLKVNSVNWYTYPTATLQMDHLRLQLSASLYRDKRLPFLQRSDRPLPSHMLHRIPVQLKIDTVTLVDSFVRYEEMPESGDSTGMVFFDRLNASIVQLHNNRNMEVDTKMHATASFMGQGELDAHFTFPYDTLHPYRVAGTLKNFPMVSINNILGSAAKAKIESGIMQDLIFNFAYDNERSDGAVEMRYQDLKVLTLRENKKNEQSVSRLKTLLLNTFIIKKDLDEESKDDQRKGDIDFYRDTKKSVFNFWWKSILSGIKSAYNLDNLPLKAASGENRKDRKKKRPLKDVFSRIFKKEDK